MIDLLKERDYSWAYFQLHANQRMATFNFFLVLAALMTTGLVGSIKPDFHPRFIAPILGTSLSIVAFIFWKLDCRVRFLIKHSEHVLKQIESEIKKANASEPYAGADLFFSEEIKSSSRTNNWRIWSWKLSYSECFLVVYMVFGMFGLIATIAGVLVK